MSNDTALESTLRAVTSRLEHTRSCANLANRDENCTCGLLWRIELQTEREMHAAWRKRAEEAEARLELLEREPRTAAGSLD